MESFDINGWRSWRGRDARAKDPGRPIKKLRLPLCDLVGVDIKLLRQFDQCLRALDRRQGYFRLEAGLWFRRARLVIVAPVLGILCQVQGRIPLIPSVRFFRASSGSALLFDRFKLDRASIASHIDTLNRWQ